MSGYQRKFEDEPFMIRHNLFSVQATFTSNETVSSLNCRWWSYTNPNFAIKTRDTYTFKTNVCCRIYKNKIFGPSFHESLNAYPLEN